MVLWFLCPGAPEGSASSGSDFKATQKLGQSLKSHRTYWVKPGIKPATPGLQYIVLSPTPQRLQKTFYNLEPDVLPAIDETCDLLFVWELKTFWGALK